MLLKITLYIGYLLKKIKRKKPIARVFKINYIGRGKELYDRQDKVVYKGLAITVGIEVKTT